MWYTNLCYLLSIVIWARRIFSAVLQHLYQGYERLWKCVWNTLHLLYLLQCAVLYLQTKKVVLPHCFYSQQLKKKFEVLSCNSSLYYIKFRSSKFLTIYFHLLLKMVVKVLNKNEGNNQLKINNKHTIWKSQTQIQETYKCYMQ